MTSSRGEKSKIISVQAPTKKSFVPGSAFSSYIADLDLVGLLTRSETLEYTEMVGDLTQNRRSWLHTSAGAE